MEEKQWCKRCNGGQLDLLLIRANSNVIIVAGPEVYNLRRLTLITLLDG
jgi:hypothetical protein